jgi:hypothetical protein
MIGDEMNDDLVRNWREKVVLEYLERRLMAVGTCSELSINVVVDALGVIVDFIDPSFVFWVN